MQPIIGVPLRAGHLEDGRAILYLSERVRRTLQEALGEVKIITPQEDCDFYNTKGNQFPELSCEQEMMLVKSLKSCDGIFLPGGMKITPYDRFILNYAITNKIPILGVCLGMQIMSCYEEEIKLEKNETMIKHYQEEDQGFSHEVKINRDSKLYKILGTDNIVVNSFHHYHATENHIYKTVAQSSDDIIEAIEYPSEAFNIGIQWHPEISYHFDLNSRKIIDAFIEAAREYAKTCQNKEKVL